MSEFLLLGPFCVECWTCVRPVNLVLEKILRWFVFLFVLWSNTVMATVSLHFIDHIIHVESNVFVYQNQVNTCTMYQWPLAD